MKNTIRNLKNACALIACCVPAVTLAGNVQVSNQISVKEYAGVIDVVFTHLETGPAVINYRTNFAVSEGAQASVGDDYSATSGTLVWADTSDSRQTLQIRIADDRLTEETEDFAIELSAGSDATTINGSASEVIVVSIVDNDQLRATVTKVGTVAAEVTNAFNSVCPELEERDSKTDFQQALSDLCQIIEDAPAAEVSRALRAISPAALVPQLAIPTVTFGEQTNVIDNRMQSLRGGVSAPSRTPVALNVNGADITAPLLNSLVATDADDAMANLPRYDFYVNGTVTLADKDTTDFSTGFDSDGVNFVVGGDYRARRNWYIGYALGISQLASNFNEQTGSLESDGYNMLFYSTFAPTPTTYVDAYISTGSIDLDTKRVIEIDTAGYFERKIAQSETAASQVGFGISGGYDFALRAGATLSAFAKVDVVNTSVDGFTETGGDQYNLNIDDRELKSSNFSVGSRYQLPISTRHGVFVPYTSLALNHNFSDERAELSGTLVADPSNVVFGSSGDEVDTSHFDWSLGLSAVFTNGLMAFVDYRTMFGNDNLNTHDFSAGLRFEF